MSVLTILCISLIPVTLAALVFYFLFRVSTGEIDGRYIENGTYTTDFSLCRHLDEKMLYYPAHGVGMKYLKVYMNIILPWLAVSRVLSVLTMGEEPLDLFTGFTFPSWSCFLSTPFSSARSIPRLSS